MKRSNKAKVRKHILISVIGTTPQVVTETLFALLMKKSVLVDEIYLITTAEGKEKIFEAELESKIKDICLKNGKPAPRFSFPTHVFIAKEEGNEIIDVCSDKDNQLFPDVVMEIIRKFTSDPKNILHCSIAGGRKTMSVAMAYALSLFGRKQDVLSHVLVSKAFEESKKFYPENETEAEQIKLAEIPYVRLRDKLPMLKELPLARYSDFVKYAQQEINEFITDFPLIFHTKSYTVQIGEKEIKLQPFDFAFYHFVAKSKKPVNCGKQVSESTWARIWKIYKEISVAKGQTDRFAKGRQDKGEKLTKSTAKIRGTLRRALGQDLSHRYTIKTKGEYGGKYYVIELPYEKRIFK